MSIPERSALAQPSRSAFFGFLAKTGRCCRPENGKEALRQIRELMLTKHTNCIYPVEYRFVAGNSGMLSPYYHRACVTVSVSGGPGIDYWSYLLDVDAILRQYEARPHWGKLHFNRAEDMPSLYPRFYDFQAIRRKMDPSVASSTTT